MKDIKVGIIVDEEIYVNLYFPVTDLKKEGIFLYFYEGSNNLIGFINKMDIVHFIFPFDFSKYILISKLLGKKIFLQWVGTDVLLATKRRKHKVLAELFKSICNMHLTEAENLREELKLININAGKLPMISRIFVYSVIPFPEDFTVLTFLPDSRHEFYGSAIIYSLAEEFPSIKFLVVGGTERKQKSMPNIEYLGLQDDMDPIYKRSTVLVRMTEHDGNSRMVLEALSYGRPVIRSVEFPYCYKANNYEETKKHLINIMKDPQLNIPGAEYVINEYNIDKFSSNLTKLYKSVMI